MQVNDTTSYHNNKKESVLMKKIYCQSYKAGAAIKPTKHGLNISSIVFFFVVILPSNNLLLIKQLDVLHIFKWIKKT